jgi:GTP cyclohydrolase III
MLYLPGGGAMLFLTDVDHVSFEKVKGARQNNLQSATVSLQVVIGLYKRKETAALKSKPPFHKARENMSAVRRLFFFCRRPAD